MFKSTAFLLGLFFLAGISNAVVVPDDSPLFPQDFNMKRVVWNDQVDSVSGTGATNGSAVFGRVLFAQTHVMEPGWPFFFLIGGRPALLLVEVTGSGNSPEVSVEGFLDSVSLGVFCLDGPAALPASIDSAEFTLSNRFHVNLPSSWMQSGLSLRVTVGGVSRDFSQEELGLTEDSFPEANFMVWRMKVLHYEDGHTATTITDDSLENIAGALPFSKIRWGRMPVDINLDRVVWTGDEAGAAPVLVCRDEITDTNCIHMSGLTTALWQANADSTLVYIPSDNTTGSLLRYLDAIRYSAGMGGWALTYGQTEHLQYRAYGGSAGFLGWGYGEITMHEAGHSLGLPHWDQSAWNKEFAWEGFYDFPYGGIYDNGGGIGETWNWYQNIGEFVSPVCQDPMGYGTYGQERMDVMAGYGNYCCEKRSDGIYAWAGFSDFSALAMFRNRIGDTVSYSGQVPYKGDSAHFRFTYQQGYPQLVPGPRTTPALTWEHTRAYDNPGYPDDLIRRKVPWYVPQYWNIPVHTVFGTYSKDWPRVNMINDPMSYVGNRPLLLDPSDPAIWDSLTGSGFGGSYTSTLWDEHDLSIRVIYEDDSRITAIHPYAFIPRGIYADNPIGGWSYGRNDYIAWALTVPGDKPIRKIELLDRSFCVRGTDEDAAGNIRFAGNGITAENFWDDAVVMYSRTFIEDTTGLRDIPSGSNKTGVLVEWGAEGFHIGHFEGTILIQVYYLSGRRMFSAQRTASDGVCEIPFSSKIPPGVCLLRVKTSVQDRAWLVTRQTGFDPVPSRFLCD